MISRRIFLTLSSSLIISTSLSSPLFAQATKPEVFANEVTKIAINGYDPVAYFSVGEPVEGSSEFSYEWNGAIWHFSNAENKDKFAAAPEQYAPQYGGYCAYAVSRGYTAPTVPEAWSIFEGKLYLNFSLRVRKTWRKDIEGNIKKADENWPNVLK